MAVVVNARRQLAWLSIHADAWNGPIPTVDLHTKLLPPRMKRALRFPDAQKEALRRELAGEFDPQEVPMLIGKGFAVIHVQRAVTILTRINAKRERSLRRLFRALGQRLHRYDGPFAHIDGKNFEVWHDHHGLGVRSFRSVLDFGAG